MRTNIDGSLDYGSNPFIDEIVRTLIDNDAGRIEDVVSVMRHEGRIYAQARRRKGSKREETRTYERVFQPRLRRMTKEEKDKFDKLRSLEMFQAICYEKRDLRELAKASAERRPENLTELLKVLKGNGYSVEKAAMYSMMPSPFDVLTPVVVVKRNVRPNTPQVGTHYYVIDARPAYVKTQL